MKALLLTLFAIISSVIFAQTGSINGRIFEEKSNQALPFSNIFIEGTDLGATSDFDGNFLITGVEPGIYRLTASSLGYATAVTEEINVTPGKTTNIDIAMQETAVQLAEVEIKASIFKKRDEAPVSLRTVGLSEIENAPGANRDISKVIQNLPGIAAIPGQNRNDIIVRGGASNENRFFLDEVEIPNINHFATQGASGGTNGILNADFIREVNFYSGAFPANRGNALSGVFNFRQIDGNSDALRFRGSLGASEVSLTADGPLSDNTTFIISARRSYLQFLFKLIGLPFLPTFNDVQFKVKTKIDDRNEITFIGLGAFDVNVLDTDIENPDEYQRYLLGNIPESEQWSYALGAVYKHYRNNGYQTFVLSRNMLYNRSYKYFNNIENSGNLISDYNSFEAENKFRFENYYNLSSGLKFSYGLSGEYSKYSNETFRRLLIQNEIDTLMYNSDIDLFKYGLYGQASKNLINNRLTISFGFRIDGNTYSESMQNPLPQFSPRLSATWAISDKWSLNANVGRYYQLPPYTSLGYRNNLGILVNKNNDIKYIQAEHAIAGIEFRPNANSIISIETFYKLYNNYPFSVRDSMALAFMPVDFGVVGDTEIESTAEGRAYGIELLAQTRLNGNISLVASYTYAISEFKDIDGKYISSSWDNRHVFIVTATKKFKKNWFVGVKWRFAGGLPYTPYNIELSEQVAAWNLRNAPYFDYSLLNANRFGPFHQLDFRIDKQWNFKRSALKLYIDIQNVYNFKSETQDIITNKDPDGNILYNENDPTLYNLRAIDKEGSGTIVPTIGIIIDF
ncbi:MAG TPA: TonB-dependent receptor [Bacteroidales bacterium]|nr:TonB-dependent receptor [Bacteroidales bacterium]